MQIMSNLRYTETKSTSVPEPEPDLVHKWQNAAYDTAIRVIEEEASYCAMVAADEKDWLPLRASAFEKSETMKRCAAIIRTLKHT